MKYLIKHEIRGRIRIRAVQKQMSNSQADTLLYYLNQKTFITSAKVHERSMDIIICYTGSRDELLEVLNQFRYEEIQVPQAFLNNSGRALNSQYFSKLVGAVALRGINKLFLPYPLKSCLTTLKAVRYILRGVKVLAKGRIEVPVLDATAIGISILRKDVETAGSIMFLLGIGEILEEWTHKRSVNNLARMLSLNVGKVWLYNEGSEILIPTGEVREKDVIIVHMGNVIPFDGTVVSGEAMVNQASLTGESVAVRKQDGGYVYAGTVVEEGELIISVNKTGGSSRYDKIVTMIEESEKLKSGLESKAQHLADRLVPYTFAGTALTYLLTKNTTRALSVLMVDFSCALQLAMPVTVLSAIREAGLYNITVKGGKYLEAVAEAQTIVFDKTGTLTKAKPTVVEVISFNGESPDELLRMAACMEEHFPHSMAKAVVDAAKEKNLEHEEMHSKVEYIVAHGISTIINGKRANIGSYHYIFEDRHCVIPDNKIEDFRQLPGEYSHLYLSIEDQLAAVICIEDPLRQEAKGVIDALRKSGFKKIVMMTGDSERTASVIAKKVGVDEYYSEVLPEDKAHFIEQEKASKRKVIMIGDGINDSPALSAADVGIAISDGAEIAREIADITIGSDDLQGIVTLKIISDSLMKKIARNYRLIVGVNTGLILLGIGGIIQPTTSALLHNSSTLAITLKSMQNLIVQDAKK